MSCWRGFAASMTPAIRGLCVNDWSSTPAVVSRSSPVATNRQQAIGQFQMGTFEAYFSSTILNFLAVLIAIFAIVNGTGTLAGEEESGVLELMVSLPLHRWQIVVAKALAMGLSALVILGITAVAGVLAFVAIAGQLETGITAGDLVLPILSAWPITLVFAMIGLFFGALLPQRRHALSLAALVLAGSFLGNNLLPMIEGMEPMVALLPFHYHRIGPAVFTEGVRIADTLVLTGAAAVFLLLAVLSFDRRDLTVGAWFWRRPRTPRVERREPRGLPR